jgi:hypothetical protein
MATQSSSRAIDIQKVITGAAKLEVKVLLAGMECLQVWINQAELSNIASDTLEAIRTTKARCHETRAGTRSASRMRKSSETFQSA